MYIFLLIAFPAFIFGWFLSEEKNERLSYGPLLVLGLLAAGFVCVIKSFFIFTSHLWTDSFIEGSWYLYYSEILLPCIIMFGLYLIFSKDPLDYKANAFIPLLGAFYTVFLPYKVLQLSEAESLYTLFVKPVLYISMVIYISTFLKKIFKAKNDKSTIRIIANSAMILIFSIVPALLETFWYLGGTAFIYIPLALVYAVFAFVLYLKLRGIKLNKSK